MPAPVPGGTHHTNTNGNGNGNHEWPRAEYRSPDTTAG
jgi:hypothetical protein